MTDTAVAGSAASPGVTPPSPWRVLSWLGRAAASRPLAIVLTFAAMIAGIATFGMLSGFIAPPGGQPEAVFVLLNIDLVLLLCLGALVAARLARLWSARRRGSAGSRLHVRIVGMFSALAVAPAIIVAVFSATFFNLGIQAWFNDRIRTALDQSIAVSEAYARDHQEFIRTDILSMIAQLNRQRPQMLASPEALSLILQRLAEERSLTEAMILRGDGTILAHSRLSFLMAFDRPDNRAMQRAAAGDVVIMTSGIGDRVRALARIDALIGAYLYVGRFADAMVLDHVARLSNAVSDYRDLDLRRSNIQITFTLFYVIVSLLLLVSAVWLGLVFANRMIRPLSDLAAATERVRTGDLGVRVREEGADDELTALARAFNRMTDQLEEQRAELIDANQQIDNRRLFTEAVLSGVTVGVLGLDREGRIFLPNRSALELLACDAEDLVGCRLAEAVPEIADLHHRLENGAQGRVEDKVSLERGGGARELTVRITAQSSAGRLVGAVVTFDDMTDLVRAQRAAAWAGVARRIAHEIKNPLTPIQLAAERLRRKYLNRIAGDTGVFSNCVDTIQRQVGVIRAMVDEFSSFARMPAPRLRDADLVPVVEQTVAMHALAHPEIAFDFAPPAHPIRARCDVVQVEQAITNLLSNAIDAIAGQAGTGEATAPGRIVVKFDDGDPAMCAVAIDDNGCGLPTDPDQRARLTAPYVTTRENGTGLGLAIVKKIMEDHGGELTLDNGILGGARVRVQFARAADEPSSAEADPRNTDPSHGR